MKYPLIRTIYLYVFALVGLAMIIISGVQFVELGLKAYVFKYAEEQYRSLPSYPPSKLYITEPTEDGETVTDVKLNQQLSQAEKEALGRWLAEFKAWEKTQKDIDPIKASRHRTAANALAMIIIGLPVFLYHWGVIQIEVKHQKLA